VGVLSDSYFAAAVIAIRHSLSPCIEKAARGIASWGKAARWFLPLH
jgi:hypothetical protein